MTVSTNLRHAAPVEAVERLERMGLPRVKGGCPLPPSFEYDLPCGEQLHILADAHLGRVARRPLTR